MHGEDLYTLCSKRYSHEYCLEILDVERLMIRLNRLTMPGRIWGSRLKDVLSALFGPRYPLHSDQTGTPVFIIGSGRSGNTLLRRLLMANSKIYIPPETYVLGDVISIFQRYSHLPWQHICRLILGSFSISEDFSTFPRQSLHLLHQEIINLPEDKRSLEAVLSAFYLFMAKEAKPGATIWGDKTPMNSFHLNKIDKVFPNARYIHIFRDGCDVVSSYLEMGRYTALKDAANRWSQSVDLCRRFSETAGARYKEVKYETLVMRPLDTVNSVMDFLGIDRVEGKELEHVDPKTLGDVSERDHYSNVMRPISASSIGKGRKKLSKDDLEILQSIIGRQLYELGYPPANK